MLKKYLLIVCTFLITTNSNSMVKKLINRLNTQNSKNCKNYFCTSYKSHQYSHNQQQNFKNNNNRNNTYILGIASIVTSEELYKTGKNHEFLYIRQKIILNDIIRDLSNISCNMPEEIQLAIPETESLVCFTLSTAIKRLDKIREVNNVITNKHLNEQVLQVLTNLGQILKLIEEKKVNTDFKKIIDQLRGIINKHIQIINDLSANQTIKFVIAK